MVKELRQIEENNLRNSTISVGELIYGAIDKRELTKILKDISSLRVLPVTEAISQLHLRLMTEYSLSHNLSLPDALIAATAIVHDCPLFTLNRKDFRYIEGVQLYEPSWLSA